MQFNGETNNLDLVSDIDYWAGTDINSYPIKDKTRNANFGLDRATAQIMKADRKWKWDDTNNSGLPIATTALVAGQQDYSLSVNHLKIVKIRIKDPNGNLISLLPVDSTELSDSQLNAPNGTPTMYSKNGNSVFFYPTPNYSYALGLEIQFQRPASYFAITDTTKTPGFAIQFHRLVSLYAARDYCAINSVFNRMKVIDLEIQRYEADIIDFYSVRNDDQKQSFRVGRDDYGQIALGNSGQTTYNKPNGFTI
jgi:hypothetical protein